MSDLKKKLGKTRDLFDYVLTYVFGFPEEDQMTLSSAVKELMRGVRDGLDGCRSQTTIHWLNLALRELESAEINLVDSDILEKHLREARVFFDYAYIGKKLRADFVVGRDGQVREQ